MDKILKKRGWHLWTRVGRKWWHRYNQAGLSGQGSGEYWIKDGCLFFQHDARPQPVRLPLKNLSQIEVCPCGRKAGIPVIKLVWEEDGRWFSAGFVLSGLVDRSTNLLTSLRIEGLRS